MELLINDELDFEFRNITNRKGEIFLIQISKCDVEFYDKHPWIISTGYVALRKGTNGVTKFYHKYIYPTENGFKTDHINCNKLDNRRSNFRSATNQQNTFNSFVSKNNKSGYKGVVNNLKSKVRPWSVFIKINRKSLYLGRYKTIEEAAQAYNFGAIKYFGEFANLNIIPEK